MSIKSSSKQNLTKVDGYFKYLLNNAIDRASNSKTTEKKSRNSNKETSLESDSFYKYYNKEIKVN